MSLLRAAVLATGAAALLWHLAPRRSVLACHAGAKRRRVGILTPAINRLAARTPARPPSPSIPVPPRPAFPGFVAAGAVAPICLSRRGNGSRTALWFFIPKKYQKPQKPPNPPSAASATSETIFKNRTKLGENSAPTAPAGAANLGQKRDVISFSAFSASIHRFSSKTRCSPSYSSPATRHKPLRASGLWLAASRAGSSLSSPATSHQPPATSHQPPATSHQPPATMHKPLPSVARPARALSSPSRCGQAAHRQETIAPKKRRQNSGRVFSIRSGIPSVPLPWKRARSSRKFTRGQMISGRLCPP